MDRRPFLRMLPIAPAVVAPSQIDPRPGPAAIDRCELTLYGLGTDGRDIEIHLERFAPADARQVLDDPYPTPDPD